MAYFKDAEEVYDTIGKLFADLTSGDDDLAAAFLGADTIVRYEYTDPTAVITVELKADHGSVQFGESDLDPEVTMSMSADTAHRFWLGEVNVTTALARGEIRANGPVAKLLRLVPLPARLPPLSPAADRAGTLGPGGALSAKASARRGSRRSRRSPPIAGSTTRRSAGSTAATRRRRSAPAAPTA